MRAMLLLKALKACGIVRMVKGMFIYGRSLQRQSFVTVRGKADVEAKHEMQFMTEDFEVL